MLRNEDVQWVVNSIGELGVKIGTQFFFMYKGRSLVYDTKKLDEPMHWRPIGKREFGECAYPINYADPSKVGTVSLDDGNEWHALPPSSKLEPSETPRERIATALTYLRSGFLVCPRCGEELSTADTDAEAELREAAAELTEPAPRSDIPGMRSHVMSGAAYSDDIRSANTKRKRR